MGQKKLGLGNRTIRGLKGIRIPRKAMSKDPRGNTLKMSIRIISLIKWFKRLAQLVFLVQGSYIFRGSWRMVPSHMLFFQAMASKESALTVMTEVS